MQRMALKAQVREGVGKGTARSLRRSGLIPAVLYGRGRDPRPVTVDGKAFSAVIHTHARMNVLIDLDLAGNGSSEPAVVMVKEVQRDVFRQQPIHVDFHAISLTDRMEFHVPIVLKGTAKGIAEGGVVEHHLREALVECLPTEIPEVFDLDVTELLVGRSLHASDLTMPEGVVLKTPVEGVVVTVLVPRVHEEAAPAAAVTAEGVPVAAEGAPAATEGAPAAAAAPEAPTKETPARPGKDSPGKKEKPGRGE